MSAKMANKPPVNTAKMRVRIIPLPDAKISVRSIPTCIIPVLIGRDKLTTVTCARNSDEPRCASWTALARQFDRHTVQRLAADLIDDRLQIAIGALVGRQLPVGAGAFFDDFVGVLHGRT